MTRFRAVLLDIDGTLLDSNDLHAEAWHEALAHHGFTVPLERIRRMIGMGGDKLVPELTGFAADSPTGAELSAYRSRLFVANYLPRVEPFPRVRELLERLREHERKLVVATSASHEELTGLLA